jgi:hypothetical protein
LVRSLATSEQRRPMNRLIEAMVFLGFVMAWRRATWPTSRSPSLVNATTEGVVRPPSAFGITTGSPPSITATTEFVVPRSIPIAISSPEFVLAICLMPLRPVFPAISAPRAGTAAAMAGFDGLPAAWLFWPGRARLSTGP